MTRNAALGWGGLQILTVSRRRSGEKALGRLDVGMESPASGPCPGTVEKCFPCSKKFDRLPAASCRKPAVASGPESSGRRSAWSGRIGLATCRWQGLLRGISTPAPKPAP